MSGLFVQVFDAARQALGVVPVSEIVGGQSLIPSTDDAYDIGSALLRWKDAHIAGYCYVYNALRAALVTSSTGIFLDFDPSSGFGLYLQGHATGLRSLTLPDASGNVVVDSVATTFTAAQQFNNGIVLRSAALGRTMAIYAYNNEPANGEFRTVFVAGALPSIAGSHYLVSIDASAAAIPDPAGGGTVDVECRAAVASILAMLRTTYPAMVTP